MYVCMYALCYSLNIEVRRVTMSGVTLFPLF